MGRKSRNVVHEEALQRLAQASQNVTFQHGFAYFAERWHLRGCPNLIHERNTIWDEEHRHTLYYGLYYDLRELCDSASLVWPTDAGYLMRLLYAQEQHDDLATALLPDDCPPRDHWQWFRMARRGLGLPRPNELDALQRIRGVVHKTQPTYGLTFEEIADLEFEGRAVGERTIRDAVKGCWQYLSRGGDLNRIGGLADLDETERFHLMFHPRLMPAKPEE
jgi:hypothetical protein